MSSYFPQSLAERSGHDVYQWNMSFVFFPFKLLKTESTQDGLQTTLYCVEAWVMTHFLSLKFSSRAYTWELLTCNYSLNPTRIFFASVFCLVQNQSVKWSDQPFWFAQVCPSFNAGFPAFQETPPVLSRLGQLVNLESYSKIHDNNDDDHLLNTYYASGTMQVLNACPLTKSCLQFCKLMALQKKMQQSAALTLK